MLVTEFLASRVTRRVAVRSWPFDDFDTRQFRPERRMEPLKAHAAVDLISQQSTVTGRHERV